MLASPVLTRLYTPRDFGTLAVYTSFITIIVVMMSWRYELAIPFPENPVVAANLLIVCLVITGVMSLFLGLILYVIGDNLLTTIKAALLRPYLWVLPLGLLGAGVYQSLNYWAIRKKAFDMIAKTKLSQGIGLISTQIGLGLAQVTPLGLLIGDVIGRFGGVSTLARLFWQQDRSVLKHISIDNMWKAMKRYHRFPLFSSFSGLMNSASLQVPPLLFAILYGPDVAGWFSLGQRFIGLPMALIGYAVAQVYLSEASSLTRDDPEAFHRLFRQTVVRLLITGLPLIATIGLGGSWLFLRIFGENWVEAGRYVQVLTLMFITQFISSPISQTLAVLERQRLALIWDAGRLLTVVTGIWYTYVMNWSAFTSISIYGLIMTAFYLILIGLCDLSLKQSKRQFQIHRTTVKLP